MNPEEVIEEKLMEMENKSKLTKTIFRSSKLLMENKNVRALKKIKKGELLFMEHYYANDNMCEVVENMPYLYNNTFPRDPLSWDDKGEEDRYIPLIHQKVDEHCKKLQHGEMIISLDIARFKESLNNNALEGTYIIDLKLKMNIIIGFVYAMKDINEGEEILTGKENCSLKKDKDDNAIYLVTEKIIDQYFSKAEFKFILLNQILTNKELYFPYGHHDIVDKEIGRYNPLTLVFFKMLHSTMDKINRTLNAFALRKNKSFERLIVSPYK